MADAYKGDSFENPIEIHSNRTYNQASPRTFFDLAIIDSDSRVSWSYVKWQKTWNIWAKLKKKIRINCVSALGSCLKKLTCKGTSRQVLIRVYRLEEQSVMLVCSTQLLWIVAPLRFSLVELPPPLPCMNKPGFIKDEYCSWVQYKSGPGGRPSM
jgi:hypothetical protein